MECVDERSLLEVRGRVSHRLMVRPRILRVGPEGSGSKRFCESFIPVGVV